MPSLAGPKRPQDRVALTDAKAGFLTALGSYTDDPAATADLSIEEQEVSIGHGAVVIAAITSCTNTSNPSVMVAAGLLARNAVERGLTRKPWVKTTLAPGSKVVSDYYDRAGLTPYLDKLGFDIVGYGCTTCIGNSGPLPEAVSAAVNARDLAVVSVLSGNRNFEGRINPDVKMNYLAIPAAGRGLRDRRADGPRPDDRAPGHRPLGHAGVPQRPLALAGRGPVGHGRLHRRRDVRLALRRRLRRRRGLAVAADPCG